MWCELRVSNYCSQGILFVIIQGNLAIRIYMYIYKATEVDCELGI